VSKFICCSSWLVKHVFVHQTLKNIFFQKYARLADYIKPCCKKETVKKANVFEFEELERFVLEGDRTDTWILARMMILVVGYFGGNRGDELKRMQQQHLKPCPGGYNITYIPAKQQKQVKSHQ
jgi:hypothetical protein